MNSFAPLLSRSFKDTFKERKKRLRELLRLACMWRYQLKIFSHSNFNDVRFRYFGLKSHQEAAILMLGLDSQQLSLGSAKQSAFISEIPLLGSICIPHNLTSLITLKNQSLEDIVLGFQKRKRKYFNKAASGYLLKIVTDINDVARINQEMLIPYAANRYGKAAYQLPWQDVMDMAFKSGKLHLLIENGLEVACVIGYETVCNNERYWHSFREGFPDFIFSNGASYTEKNMVITYLELQWALSNSFDYYDMGSNSAFVERGVVYYKRTFGAELSVRDNYNYFYLRLPKILAAKFYWEQPLFAVEGKAVVLHLGLPDEMSADEVAERYKLLNYRGLSKVYLHCDSAPSSAHTEAVVNIYSYQKAPPVLKVCKFN